MALAMVALAVSALLLWSRRSRPVTRPAPSPGTQAADVTGPAPPRRSAGRMGPAAQSGPPPTGDTPAHELTAEEEAALQHERMGQRRWAMVNDALELNRFPPDSQPLTSKMTDLLRPPYSRHENPIPVSPADAADPETAPYFLFTGPRYLITRDQPLQATLEVYRGRPKEGARPQRIAVEIVATQLLVFGQPNFRPVGPLPLGDAGRDGDVQAGDLQYGVVFDPATLPGLQSYNGMLLFTVDLRVPGVANVVQVKLDFMMTAVSPARFTGKVRERLTDSGLELLVQVDVKRKGYYFTQGLLFDAGGAPIGYAVARDTWDVGLHEARFAFFGLLFHQAKAEAPFVLRWLTGSRLPDPDDGEPFKTELEPYLGEYRTRTYHLSDFSSAEYESAEKQRLIEALEDLAEKNPEKTRAAAPVGTGEPDAGTVTTGRPGTP